MIRSEAESKVFLQTARYATTFCDKWDKCIKIKDVMDAIPERFRHKALTLDMAVESCQRNDR
jgi:hypothetical protein